jgi:hypothetical protein
MSKARKKNRAVLQLRLLGQPFDELAAHGARSIACRRLHETAFQFWWPLPKALCFQICQGGTMYKRHLFLKEIFDGIPAGLCSGPGAA